MPLVDVRTLNTPPVPGRYYKVPCLKKLGRWWPLTGEKHDDKEYLKFAPQHYHLDVRFIPPNLVAREWSGNYGPYSHFFAWPVQDERIPDGWIDTGEPELRARLCYRDWPRYPVIFRALHEAYKDSKLPDCRICPHRGYPLNQISPREGKLICPLHGLAWDAQTGANLPVEGPESSLNPAQARSSFSLSASTACLRSEARRNEAAARKIHARIHA